MRLLIDLVATRASFLFYKSIGYQADSMKDMGAQPKKKIAEFPGLREKGNSCCRQYGEHTTGSE